MHTTNFIPHQPRSKDPKNIPEPVFTQGEVVDLIDSPVKPVDHLIPPGVNPDEVDTLPFNGDGAEMEACHPEGQHGDEAQSQKGEVQQSSSKDGEDDDVTPAAQANLRASQRVSNKGRKGRPWKNADGDAPKPKSKARSKAHKESKGCPKAKSRGRPPKAEKSELKPRVRGGKKKDKSGDDVKNGSAGSCPDPITPSEPAPKRRARTKSVARSPPQSESADGRTFGCAASFPPWCVCVVLLLAILLLFYTDGLPMDETCQTWDALEICSCKALLSRVLRFGRGIQVAAFDLIDWEGYATTRGLPGCRNPLDMATSAGMALLLLSCLRAKKRVVVHFGLPCSSWVLLSRATTARTYLAPLGDLSVSSVKLGNLLCARMCILIYIILAHKGTFTIEQPSTSLLFRHPRFRQIVGLVRVYSVRFWMRLLGSKYPKRSVIWGNTQKIWRFKTGQLKTRKSKKSMLVKRYRDQRGRSRFVGKTKALKHSACYPLGFGLRYLSMFEDLQQRNFDLKDPCEVPPASEITMGHVLDAMKHNFGDLWEDAEMWEVCQYLYGNHKCTVPEKVKAQIPKL
ncbi:unnamed protein product [Cladocopium goreaui]|uniref:Uncharacterized protein n=1 Tax=Cladocopium goreaui TaxID=2562237 RepID=A0A9P1GF76_9DINO|nr:unnamed protein product [Cladocopium goreaui]